ncbi:MAG: hypothetical protein WC263_04895 [Candidatus Micrarchaeia archaeon]|jgi:hypothetical protein
MDPFEINEIEKSVNMLIASTLSGDALGRAEASILVAAIGAPALNCLAGKLEIALRECDSNVAIALSMAITDIWGLHKFDPLVPKSKEKVRTLVSRCPPFMEPEIKMVLHDLRQALGQKPGTRAPTRFLDGPGALYANISVAIDRQKNVRAFPICRN